MAKKTTIRSSRKPKEVIDFNSFDFSDLNEKFYDFDREELLKYKPLEERLSSNFIDYSTILNDEHFIKTAVKFLSHTAYSLFFLITKEKKPNISFNVDSYESYCSLTSNFIQIGIQLLFDVQIPRKVKVDSITAIIYHEFFHKRFTIPDLLQVNFISSKDYYENEATQKLVKTFISNNFTGSLGTIVHNIFEDRRIEKLGIKKFQGLVFSFDVLRKYAFYLNSQYRAIEKVNDYIIIYLLYKILMPERVDQYYKKITDKYDELALKTSFENDEEKELWKIFSIIKEINELLEHNWNYVISEKYEDILHITKEVIAIIPETIQATKYESSSESFEYFTGDDSELKENNISQEFKSELEKIVEIEKEKVENAQSKNSEILKDSDVSVEKLTGLSSEFSMYNEIKIINAKKERKDKILYNKAKKMSSNIFKNLGFLDAHYKQFTETYELSEGELDDSELFSINWNKNLFKSEEEINGYNLDFGVLLDESGSMTGLIDEAKTAFLALILALKDNKHINLFAYGHTANSNETGESFNAKLGTINLYKYYNTLENFIDIDRIYSARARANNADGFAIQKLGEIMMKSKNKNKILIVISDGQPHASSYQGQSAIEHTRKSVEWCEHKGITVIQLCVAYIENSSEMFKHYIEYNENKNFFNELKNVLLKKVQQFFNEL